MRIVGLRVDKYVRMSVSGGNCEFVYTPAEFDKHILYGVLEDSRKVRITLSDSEEECGSGWGIVRYGHMVVEIVEEFEEHPFVAKADLCIDDVLPDFDPDISIANEVFTFSNDGGCIYVPLGYYTVNMSLFEENGDSTVSVSESEP